MAFDVAIDMCYFSKTHEGGKDEVAYNLLRGFEKLGVSNRIVCFCHKTLVPVIREKSANVGIHVVPRIRTKGYFPGLTVLFRHIYIKQLSKKLGVKVLLFANKPSSRMKYPIPTIEIPHDIQVFENGNLPGVRYEEKEYKTKVAEIKSDFLNRDYIIAISDFDKSEMIKFMPWAAVKIKRIYNPIRFIKPAVDKKIEKKYITVLNIQWLHKNVETVIKAFGQISDKTDLRLILVGKLPENIDYLRSLVNKMKLGEKIIFTGFVSNDELDKIINETRIYVNASFFEGFGMTAVEMMGREIPTIVAKATAMPEVTRGLCRYYEPADNYKALADTILDELENPYSHEELKTNAEEMKKAYDYVNISREYWAFFEECMKCNGERVK